MERDHARAAAVVLGPAQRSQRHHRCFPRDAQRLAEVIPVEHVIAGDDDLSATHAVDQVRQSIGTEVVPRAEATELFRLERVRRAERADQRGRRVDDVAAAEDDPPAVADDAVAFGKEAPVVAVLVLAALHVHVGPDAVEQADRRRLVVDVHRNRRPAAPRGFARADHPGISGRFTPFSTCVSALTVTINKSPNDLAYSR